MMMFFIPALSLGLLSSFHCVGMCGPIALALPVRRNSKWTVFIDVLGYHVSRAVSYAVLGAVFGAIGKGFSIAGLQSWLSIVVGSVLLLVPVAWAGGKMAFSPKFLYAPVSRLKTAMAALFRRRGLPSLMLLGLLNGLLPCGMVYIALAASVATGDPVAGATFMFLFGIGTMPAMVLLTVMREKISFRLREKMRRAVPVFVGVLGALMILRGLNLGIPLISPKVIVENNHCVHSCCAKK